MPATCSCAVVFDNVTSALDALGIDLDRGLGILATESLENARASLPELERNCGIDVGAGRTALETMLAPLASFTEKQAELTEPAAIEQEIVRENIQADLRTLRRDLADSLGRVREAVDTTMDACTTPACACAKAHVDLSNLLDRAVTAMGTANPVDLGEIREQFRPALESASTSCGQPVPAEHTFADVETALDTLVNLAPVVRSPQRRRGPYITVPVPGPVISGPEERMIRVPGRVIEYTPTVMFKIAPKVIREVISAQMIRGPPERVM